MRSASLNCISVLLPMLCADGLLADGWSAVLQPESLVAQELQRVGAGQSLPPMDMTRFALTPPPAERANDLGAWKTANANARAQLEHQAVRLTNLELLFKFGANASKAHLNHINASAAQSERQVRKPHAWVSPHQPP